MNSCNSTYRLRYWNISSGCLYSMNWPSCNSTYRLRYWNRYHAFLFMCMISVATVFTVYGIETLRVAILLWHISSIVATVLTVYGIETKFVFLIRSTKMIVATVLTVYGIETDIDVKAGAVVESCNSTYRLRYWNSKTSLISSTSFKWELQQYLPFTVLKPKSYTA